MAAGAGNGATATRGCLKLPSPTDYDTGMGPQGGRPKQEGANIVCSPPRTGSGAPEKIRIDAWRHSKIEFDRWASALLLIKPTGTASIPSPRSTQLLDLTNIVYALLDSKLKAPEGISLMAKHYPADPERPIFTSFLQWSLNENRQLWFGQDFLIGEFNHFL
jgi:hypothetical protein